MCIPSRTRRCWRFCIQSIGSELFLERDSTQSHSQVGVSHSLTQNQNRSLFTGRVCLFVSRSVSPSRNRSFIALRSRPSESVLRMTLSCSHSELGPSRGVSVSLRCRWTSREDFPMGPIRSFHWFMWYFADRVDNITASWFWLLFSDQRRWRSFHNVTNTQNMFKLTNA